MTSKRDANWVLLDHVNLTLKESVIQSRASITATWPSVRKCHSGDFGRNISRESSDEREQIIYYVVAQYYLAV